MTKKLDDLEALRTLVGTLESFEKADQERIIRWACEKLGLPFATPGTPTDQITGKRLKLEETFLTQTGVGSGKDIKAFVSEKRPMSDNQFAATVAYYYRFEASEAQRKDSITADDLQEACRKAGRERLKNPAQTLINAHSVGLIDKAEKGAYAINSVGENLVAMTLPGGKADSSGAKRRTKRNIKIKKLSLKGKAGSPKRRSK